MKLTVLGAGCWGLTLAWLLTNNFENITIWGREQDLSDDLKSNKHCSKPLEVQLDNKVEITSDLKEAIKNADIILSVVATSGTRDVCEKLKEDFDFILVDCPAGIEQGFQNAVAGASEAIVVTTPEMSAVRDADRIIGLLEAKEEIKSYKLLLNRVRPNLIKSNDMMSVDDVVEILSADLIGIIPEDTGIITSTNKGEPIVNDEKSLAGKAYNNVARRIIGEDVPFLNLEEPQGVMAKMKKFFSGLMGKEK